MKRLDAVVIMDNILLLLVLIALSLTSSQAWVLPRHNNNPSSRRTTSSYDSNTQLGALPAAAASLLAGSIAGSIGVGVAYPLDTIKTKAQVLATATSSHHHQDTPPSRPCTRTRTWSRHHRQGSKGVSASTRSSVVTAAAATVPATTVTATPSIVSVSAGGVAVASPVVTTNIAASASASATTVHLTNDSDNNSMTAVAQQYFGGVYTAMAGQAIIKAIVFAVNAAVLGYCQDHAILQEQHILQLLTAAATAGLVTSFFAAPVDRIKILMQAAGQKQYAGKEDAAIQAVLKTEGWKGLLGRGLACTIVREVPAYSLYFTVYGALQAWTVVTEHLGPSLAPLVYGATAGCACWIPIYPIDVIKTVIQNSEGGDEEKSPWRVATELYESKGLTVFWDGIAPRLLRQAVNHSVTFSVYDALMHQWTATAASAVVQ